MAENLKRQDGLPPAMTRLVKELSRLPGIGEKTASRLAFNLLNRVNYTSYVGNLSSPFFGRAVSAQPPRRLQLSARFAF